MLPFKVDMQNLKKQEAEEDRKMKSTACSQQAVANRIVLGSMPQNNGVQPLQQQPAKQ